MRPTTKRNAADEAAHLEDEPIGQTIEFAEPLPVRVSKGVHQATITSVQLTELKRWKRWCLVVKFQLRELGPADGVVLPGYVNLGETEKGNTKKKMRKPSTASKLARWWRIIADYTGGSRTRVSPQEFKHFLFQVVVTNVETDNREQDIPDAAQGQVVSEIVAIVSRLGTGQPATHPAPHSAQNERSATTQTSGYPPFIFALGTLKKGSVNRCERCSELTSFSYGCRPFCCMHARQHAEGAK
jgi:hypothetical protein